MIRSIINQHDAIPPQLHIWYKRIKLIYIHIYHCTYTVCIWWLSHKIGAQRFARQTDCATQKNVCISHGFGLQFHPLILKLKWTLKKAMRKHMNYNDLAGLLFFCFQGKDIFSGWKSFVIHFKSYFVKWILHFIRLPYSRSARITLLQAESSFFCRASLMLKMVR